MNKTNMEEDNLIEERKKRFLQLIKKEYIYVSIVLIILIILGAYIRSIPMQTNSQTGKPGLWDFAKNEWTLGPDLDPWLFTRYAKTIITTGSLPKIDLMRNAPLGFDTTTELQMVSYMIVLTYKLVHPFYNTNLEFYAALMPVLLFILTIISFFFFVREVFSKKGEKRLKANIISILSTLFMITIPVFISRTVAGIPEKESVGFFFMFLAFYLYLKAWKSESNKNSYILAGLAGLATALMGLTWGGVIYIYVSIAVSTAIAFIIGKVNKKETISYLIWLIISLIVTFIFTNRFSISDFVTSLDTGLSTIVFFVLIIDKILWKTKIGGRITSLRFIKNLNIPNQFLSILITIILGFLGVLILFGPEIVQDKWVALNQMMFKPIVGRWNTTVAENRQPYFWEWASSFGPFIAGFPVLFWLCMIGVVILFNRLIKDFQKKDRITFGVIFVFLLIGMVFSRYSSSALFNGENFISKLLYYSSILLFAGYSIYYYLKYQKEEENPFANISFEGIFILSVLILCLFTVRSAVRLIMTLGPIAPIFASYLCVSLGFKFFKTKEETNKTLMGIAFGIVLLLILFSLFGIPFNSSYSGFYQQAKATSYSMIPNIYNIQWQNAMKWVNTNTQEDSVFAHWWDYGYWVQSIGNRTTITDGGNAITYWNYLSGRYLLTGDNQKDALDFLYSHNATHLLIDSSDLGKYGAFSQIGSDINYDRLSGGPSTFLSNSKLIQEKQDSIIRVYQIPRENNMIGITPLEEDIYYNGTTILKDNSGLIGVSIESQEKRDIDYIKATASFIEVNTQKKVDLPLRYVYYNDTLFDFGYGLNATAYVIPSINGNSIDPFGAIIFISPRLMRGMLAQVYLLDNALNNFPRIELIHSEPNLIIASINSQNPLLGLGDFIYYNGIQGPIKIWKINYSGEEEIKEEYLDKDPTKYISWQL